MAPAAQQVFDGQSLLTPADGVLACELADGVALLDTGSSTYYALNSVAAAIWALIEKSTTIDALVEHVAATFDVSDDTARRDIESLIASLAENELVRIERS